MIYCYFSREGGLERGRAAGSVTLEDSRVLKRLASFFDDRFSGSGFTSFRGYYRMSSRRLCSFKAWCSRACR